VSLLRGTLFRGVRACVSCRQDCCPRRCCCGRCSRGHCITATALAFVSLSVVLAVLLIVVVAPAIGNQEIRGAVLTFQHINISNPRGNLFDMSASVVLSKIDPISGTISAFPLTIGYEGADFATTTMPQVSAEAGVDNYFEINTVVTVTNVDAYNTFASDLLQNDYVTWHLSGQASVTGQVAGVTQTIGGLDFTKDVPVAGMGGFQHLVVRQFSLAGSTPEEVMSTMHVSLFNPSIVSIEDIGTMCANVTYNGTQVSLVSAPDASIGSGWTDLVFSGPLLPPTAAIRQDLFDRYLAGVPAQVVASGMPCEGTAKLFAESMRAVKLSVAFPGASFNLVDSMTVEGMNLLPQDDTSVGIELNATVTMNNPLGGPATMLVEEVSMVGSLMGDGMDLGEIVVPPTPVSINQHTFLEVSPVSHALDSEAVGHDLPPAPAPLPPILPTPFNISLRVTGIVNFQKSAGGGSTEPEFARFIDDFLMNDTVTVSLHSDTTTAMKARVKCGAGTVNLQLPLRIPPATVPAAHGIPDVQVLSFDIVGQSPDNRGLAIVLRTKMTNPSRANLPMGAEAVFAVLGGSPPNQVMLGTVRAYNSSLAPGVTELSLTGSIDPPAAGLPFVGQIFTNYLAGVSTRVQTHGLQVIPGPGRPAPSWLSEAITNVRLESDLPGVQGVQLLTNLTTQSFLLDFGADGTDIVVTGAFGGLVHVPFSNVNMNILNCNANLTLYNGAMVPMASVQIINAPTTYTPKKPPSEIPPAPGGAPVVGSVLIHVEPSHLTVLNASVFTDFLAEVLLKPVATNGLRIQSSQAVALSFGNITISNVTTMDTLNLPGLNSFSDPGVEIVSVTLTEALPNALKFNALLNITTTSPLGGNLGRTSLGMYFQGQLLGNATVPEMRIQQGSNLLQAETVFAPGNDPASQLAGELFLSEYLMGRASVVELRGSPGSSPIPYLSKGVESLRIVSEVPGQGVRLITNASMNLSSVDWKALTVDGHIRLENPEPLSVTITSSALSVFVCADEDPTTYNCSLYGPQIGFFTPEDLSKDPVVIPPMDSIVTSDRPFSTVLSAQGIWDALQDWAKDKGNVNTRVNGTERVVIGGVYQTNIHYAEDNINMRLDT
jgi:hypothetical protein